MANPIIIILASMVFGIQHSGVSSLRVKHAVIDRWGKEAYSRLFTYSSILTFLLAFLSMNFWDWLYFIINPSSVYLPMFVLGLVIIAMGALIAQRASKVISVSEVADMRSDRSPELIKSGIYARIRHPLYLATVFVFLGLLLLYPFTSVIVFSLSMIIYTLVGAYLEERKLLAYYGSSYQEYKKEAGFIVPKSCR